MLHLYGRNTTYSLLTAIDQIMVRDAVLKDDPIALKWLSELPEEKAVAAGYLVLWFVEIENRIS